MLYDSYLNADAMREKLISVKIRILMFQDIMEEALRVRDII
jgi:hypothetical protein